MRAKEARVSHLQLLESEASSSTHAHVVALSLAAHDRSEQVSGPGCHLGDASSTGLAASLLLEGLAEPSLDAALPLLAEMGIGYHVVMLNHGEIRTAFK